MNCTLQYVEVFSILMFAAAWVSAGETPLFLRAPEPSYQIKTMADAAIKSVVSTMQSSPNEKQNVANEWLRTLKSIGTSKADLVRIEEVEDLFERIGAIPSNKPRSDARKTLDGFKTIITGEIVATPSVRFIKSGAETIEKLPDFLNAFGMQNTQPRIVAVPSYAQTLYVRMWYDFR